MTKGKKVIILENSVSSTENLKPKQTTRLKKVLCPRDLYIARITRSTIITHGTPICPSCNEPMIEAEAVR
jgi:hypothetical protein